MEPQHPCANPYPCKSQERQLQIANVSCSIPAISCCLGVVKQGRRRIALGVADIRFLRPRVLSAELVFVDGPWPQQAGLGVACW